MKKFIWVLFAVVLLGAAFVVGDVSAGDSWSWSPENVSVWEIQEAGLWCVTDQRDDRAYTQCFCPCENNCEIVAIDSAVETVVEYVEVEKIVEVPADPTPEPTEEAGYWICHLPPNKSVWCPLGNSCEARLTNGTAVLGKCE